MEERSSWRAAAPNQTGISLGPFSYPFAQQRHTANATGQVDLDSYNLGNPELNTSFLDLLSGRLHPPSNATEPPLSSDAITTEEFSPFLTFQAPPLSGSANDLYFVNNFQVEASNCHASFQALSPSNAKQQHMLNQSTLKAPTESRPSQGCSAGIGLSSKTLPSIANHQHRLNQSRPSIQGSRAGAEISSRTVRWPSPSVQGSSSNADRPHLLNQGTVKMTSEVRPPLSNHSSSIFRGRPRVFCMGKAGELFVSDMGHFGVICFCHGQPMSVKMFSEHSGSPSANPGEAVRLENGMTIAQWRTLFSGVMASDRGNGWDWSNSPSPIGGLLGSKPNNLPTSSQNSASINSLGISGGLGNSGEQRIKFVFPDHTHTQLGELSVLEKSVRRGGDHGHQSGLHGHTSFTKNFSVSAQSTLPALSKNHMVQDIQKSLTLVGFDGPCSNLNQGQHDAWPQLGANNITSMQEKGNLPISFSSSGIKNSFNYGNNIRRGDFPSKTLLVDQDGPSNIELRLGHSSQKNNTFTSSSPAAISTHHFGAVNLQKLELCQSLTCRTAEHPRETKKSWFNLQRTPSETSSLHRQSPHPFGSNMLNHSESELIQKNHSDLEVLTDDATKNSLISFLSHLGTGGNCSSNSTDTICNRGKELTRVTGGFCGTSKHNYLVHASDACGLSSGNTEHHGNATHEPASPFHKPTLRHASLSSVIPNLRDGSLKSTSLRHLERSLSSHENPLPHQRFCCLSDVEQQRNVVSRDDLVAAKKRNEELHRTTQQAAEDMVISVHSQQRNVVSRDDLVAAKEQNKRLYRIPQHDVEDTAVKSVHSLSSSYSGGEVQILAVKPDSSGLYDYFDCSASTQRLELCPKEHGIHFSSGHICHAEQPFQRLGTISNHCYSSRSEMCDQKEESSSFSGKCCHTASQKYLTGCCYPLVDSLAGVLNGHFCRNAKPVHINSPCDEVLKDCEGVRVGHCECLQEHRVVKNDCRVALWRDVPKKVVQHSDAISDENSLQILQAEKIIGKQRTCTAAEVLNGAHQESRSTKEQQMSIVSSGTSAPAVTEVSVEANNVVSISTDAETSKFVHDLVVDEGSRIEKCGSSSDEAHDNRECGEASAFKGKVKNINSSCNLTGELRLNSSNFKRKHQIITGCTDQTNVSQIPDIQSACKAGMGSRSTQWSSIEASVPGLDLSSAYSESPKYVGHSFCQSSVKVVDDPCEPECGIQKTVGPRKDSSFKRKHSAFFSTQPFSKKGLESYHEPLAFSGVQSIEDDHTLKKQKVSTAMKAKQDSALNGKKQYMKDGQQLDAGKPPKFMSLSSLGNSSIHGVGTPCKKARPVVCGNSGIISSGPSDKQKPAKLVSLDLILKKTSRCSLTEYEGKLCMSRNEKTRLNAKARGPNTFTKLQGENEDYCDATGNIIDPSNNASCKSKNYSSKDDGSPFGNCIIKQDGDCRSNKALKSGLHHEDVISGSMLSCEEIHKCSLNKLTGSNKHAPKSSCSVRREENEFSGVFEARNQSKTPPSTEIDAGSERHTANKCSKKCLISRSSGDARSVTSHDDKDSADELHELNKRRPNKEWNCQSIVSDSKASCCVCGDSVKEDVNQLLECNNCLIRVHQACYGIAKAPKGRWCCRPCKTNSLNTVCVLCGYGKGAMTRALKSQNAINSLLRTWKLGTASSYLNSVMLSERRNAQFLEPDSVGKSSEFGGSVRVAESVNSEVFPGVALEKDLARVNTVQHSESVSKDFQAYNSIIAGMLDPSVAQWVHMVCGLWTPGTRCPNVDTMSTFDVSGASPARKNCVCSLCNRPGGSCISCRVPNCSVLFHPWCAHQKGLLQSETEGDDNKKVGFYGRCLDHAAYIGLQDRSHHADNGAGGQEDEILTCARTEGFKGRKKDEGFDPNYQKPRKDGGPCIVSEEQKNAWLHINRKKLCTRRVVKAPSSDLEYDARKEYIRYKQSKGWKSLVVYKSGIHALGLYTSQFIGRGAMVVEYVGEIVGLRVADKREIEYQSGRRLQYKSACYFFRIDKEHIIDATRKGGIARFVNHSCRPNCAAKVISVRNEKKVVFFAERDIYQGEEITYDYHFNHEDEGQKIPCLCNSNNCRHYLN